MVKKLHISPEDKTNRNKPHVFVGMSGGVDSSVTAALLKKQGYSVTGVYMKNWSKDLPGFACPWKEDYQDAKRVAVQLGIDFKLYDFEKEYRQKVVDYMIEGFKKGITPNPDIMCNQEIKFKLFLETALKDGADLIATGHYARVKHAFSNQSSVISSQLKKDIVQQTILKNTLCVSTGQTDSRQQTKNTPSKQIADNRQQTTASLHMAADADKDQTYFLYRVTEGALAKTLFPLGDYTKPQVREMAKKLGLATASKKESMGICFVGKIGIKEFLLSELGPQQPGKIIDQAGRTIGEHDGAIFYTIGQRHGLNIGGGLPYYVTGKDMKKNEVYVTTDLDDKNLWRKQIELTAVHFINQSPKDGAKVLVRTRHRAPFVKCQVHYVKDVKGPSSHKALSLSLELEQEIRAVTPGQSVVIYNGDKVLGGGIIV